MLFVNAIAIGQEFNLPREIEITDKFSSPWGVNYEYIYELERSNNYYPVIRTFQFENGKRKSKKKTIGTVETSVIKELIYIALNDTTYDFKFKNFSSIFTPENVNNFIEEKGDNYWIKYDNQIEYIKNNLTQPLVVETSLKSYYNHNADQSNRIDGSSSLITLSFIVDGKEINISTTSIIEYALPIQINNKKHYNPDISNILAKIIPPSKTDRQKQLFGIGLLKRFANDFIRNKDNKLDRLAALNYTSEVDSLKSHFKVTNLRVVSGVSCMNWNGEERFNCQLWDTLSSLNISIIYSSEIENKTLNYSPSIIIEEYNGLIKQLLAVEFFKDFINDNEQRKISIIFDDYNCFTDKTKDGILTSCGKEYDLSNSLFLAVWTEKKGLSNWVVFPDNKYLLYKIITGNIEIPKWDNNFIDCSDE